MDGRSRRWLGAVAVTAVGAAVAYLVLSGSSPEAQRLAPTAPTSPDIAPASREEGAGRVNVPHADERRGVSLGPRAPSTAREDVGTIEGAWKTSLSVAAFRNEAQELANRRGRAELRPDEYARDLERLTERIRSSLWSSPELLMDALTQLPELDSNDPLFKVLAVALSWNTTEPPTLPRRAVIAAVDALRSSKGNAAAQAVAAAVLLSQASQVDSTAGELPLAREEIDLLIYGARSEIAPTVLPTVLIALRPYARRDDEVQAFLQGIAIASSESVDMRLAALTALFGQPLSMDRRLGLEFLGLLASGDPSAEVRAFAATKAIELEDASGNGSESPASTQLLRSALYDPSEIVRAEAARTIAAGDNPNRLGVLRAVLRSERTGKVREAALEGLYLSLHSDAKSADEAFELVKDLLRGDTDDDVRVAAANVLIPVLIKSREDGAFVSRALEARALLLQQPQSVRVRLSKEISQRRDRLGEFYEHPEFQAFMRDLAK